MATSVESEGNTVDEAIEAALQELGIDRSKVEVEVLEEEKRGFFGRSTGKARVRVTAVETGVDKTISLIQGIMRCANVEGDVGVTEQEETVRVDVSGPDLGVLIGKRGETLTAIQTIANVVLKKSGADKKLVIDVENYRERRASSLTSKARQAADRAVRTGRAVALEPMNSYDRRMVHLALQDYDAVHTASEGDEPNRKIIITPKR